MLLRGFDSPDCYQGGYVSIGNFDGVHRGHQRIIEALTQRADQASVPATVLTFDPHPITLLRPGHTPPRLSTVERKAELLARFGIDCVIAYPTNHDFLSLTPEQFFEQIVCDQLQAKGLVEGPNFNFGKGRSGTIETLRELCEHHTMTLHIVEPLSLTNDSERLVSSSQIRSLIQSGMIAEAFKFLGHPYRISGVVAEGAKRGRTIGFPTANLTDVETLLPADGVYAGVVMVNQTRFAAAVNLGPNPTFDEQRQKLEVHLIGFDSDIYGETLHLDLLERVRDTIPFPNATALQSQLNVDLETVQKIAQHWQATSES